MTKSWKHTAAVGLILLAGTVPGLAAEFPELNTDRDAFTPSTTTAKDGTVLTEISSVWIDNRDRPPTNSYPELLVRIGARERFEWRIGFNYEEGSSGSAVSAVEVGEAPLSAEGGAEANLLYGFKVQITDQEGWMPSVVLRTPITERFEVHIEWFGSWSAGLANDSVRPFVSPGLHFAVTPNFEIGCRMGWGLTRDAAGYFVDSGIGYRF